MTEYIERAAALSAVQRAFDDEECDCEVMPVVFKALQEVEAADVVEVRHGRWIWNAHHCKWECSECGGMEGECESPVCKWCGTRMDKEDGQ